MLILPRGFDEQATHQGVARLGDPAPARGRAAGVLARHHPEVGHQGAGRGEAPHVMQLRQHGECAVSVSIPRKHRSHRPPRDRAAWPPARSARHPGPAAAPRSGRAPTDSRPPRGARRRAPGQAIDQRVCAGVHARPGGRSPRRSRASPTDADTVADRPAHHRAPAPVPRPLLRRAWDAPPSSSRAQQLRQFARVATIVLTRSGLARHQRRRDDLAGLLLRDQLSLHRIPARAGSVAALEGARRLAPQFLRQAAHRRAVVGDLRDLGRAVRSRQASHRDGRLITSSPRT